jgi:hypothetical protein
MHTPHLHLPHPVGHEHDHTVALAAAAVVATVAVGVGAARLSEGRFDSRAGAPTATEETAATVTPPTVAPATWPEASMTAPSIASASGAAATAEVVVVDVAAGMRLSRAWLVAASGTEVPATSAHPTEARFDGLAAGVYTVGYQVETGAIDAGSGAVISAAEAGWSSPITVRDGASIVVALSADG